MPINGRAGARPFAHRSGKESGRSRRGRPLDRLEICVSRHEAEHGGGRGDRYGEKRRGGYEGTRRRDDELAAPPGRDQRGACCGIASMMRACTCAGVRIRRRRSRSSFIRFQKSTSRDHSPRRTLLSGASPSSQACTASAIVGRRRTQRHLAVGERTLRVGRALTLAAVAEAVGLKVVEHARRTSPRVRPAALRVRDARASSARRPSCPAGPPSPRTSVLRRAS